MAVSALFMASDLSSPSGSVADSASATDGFGFRSCGCSCLPWSVPSMRHPYPDGGHPSRTTAETNRTG